MIAGLRFQVSALSSSRSGNLLWQPTVSQSHREKERAREREGELCLEITYTPCQQATPRSPHLEAAAQNDNRHRIQMGRALGGYLTRLDLLHIAQWPCSVLLGLERDHSLGVLCVCQCVCQCVCAVSVPHRFAVFARILARSIDIDICRS